MNLSPTLILVATLLVATTSANAGMQHGAAAEARARTSGGLLEHNADPPDGRLRFVNGISAHAGTTAMVSEAVPTFPGLLLVASAQASVRAERGAVDLALLTTQARSPLGAWAESDVLAAGIFKFDTTVLGAPGSSGRLRIQGSFSAAVAPDSGPGPSSALINLSAFAQSLAPGQSSCRITSCMDTESLNLSLENGESLLDPIRQGFTLELDVKAGDLLQMSFSAGARMHGGYVVLLGNPLTNPAGRSPMAASADAMPNGFGAFTLDGGLSLAPVEGLVQQADGSYGFATPVPEPATALLVLAGGLLLIARRRR